MFDENSKSMFPIAHGSTSEEYQNVFENIETASSFWKVLCGQKGSGDENAKWLEESESAINCRVPTPPNEKFGLGKDQAVNTLRKKRSWSASGPDHLASFWWKKAYSLHTEVVKSFENIVQGEHQYPLWFAEGKTTLIPKPGEFTSANQRPITCLNTMYKWINACMLTPMNQHLDMYALMEGEQKVARVGCSGTIDNLLIDHMVSEDSTRGRRNLRMAWTDKKKAYDSVYHKWLVKMMSAHKFPEWVGKVARGLCSSWNTRIITRK